ncbi:TadE family protein [Tessaracoccus sp. ZS01]|uniref:TadE family protein n=1 Tax=Tessaracoccus sp. ZS01 TaxID=1906324 RepID=UPI00096EA639|nr:TadE family protein [Tessaracoccus sp. ZS01]MCG6568752.1 pilus assembly protein [Tessaracoccus sp. ZS01]OMG51775.1 hypothetical protein BJN44_14120 [Tessaracoccus sp. ZS01]
MTRCRNDRGAAAVEFAIISMLLVTLLMGIIEFGFAFFVQGNIAGAAREAARAHAISGDPAAAMAAATGIPAGATVDPGTCTPGAPVTVRITYEYDGLTGFFPGYTMEGQGVMRCGG